MDMRRNAFRNKNERSGYRNYDNSWRSIGCRERELPRNHFRALMYSLENEKAQILNTADARRFISQMVNYERKVDLLAQLDDNRKFGRDRIMEALSYMESNDDVENIFIPLVQVVLNEETVKPLYEPLRNRILMSLFQIPCLLETISNLKTISLGSQETAAVLCKFLIALVKSFTESRQSKIVWQLAQELKERTEIKDGRTLCAIMLLDEIHYSKMVSGEVDAIKQDLDLPNDQIAPICWVTDRIPPGGRHSNDHFNYRDIRIVPPIDELLCEENPWLPLADKSNRIIENPEMCLVDSNFRLLRADSIYAMQESLHDQTHLWKRCRIVGLNIHGKELSPLHFVIEIDEKNISGNVSDWRKNERILPHGCIVALCKNGTPLRLGKIIQRGCSNERGLILPWIGVNFESEMDFHRSMEDVVKNLPLQMKIIALRQERLSKNNTLESKQHFYHQEHLLEQMNYYDLVEVSKSFFSNAPILKALQELESVPLAEEIVHLRCKIPDNLPSRMFLPEGPSFHNFCINLGGWSTEDIVSSTSLDESQAEALWHCLMNRVALVQGPPGTGKTFMGSLVTQIIRQNTKYSILCVCYTNHALDQFLEHLLDAGESDMVRIGSRSKSKKLDCFTLSKLSESKTNFSADTKRRFGQVTAAIHSTRECLQDLYKLCEKRVGWNVIKTYLQDNQKHFFNLLSVEHENDVDGYTLIGCNRKEMHDDELWKIWKTGKKCPPWIGYDKKPFFQQIWGLNKEMRQSLINEWVQDIMKGTLTDLHRHGEEYNDLISERKALHQEKDYAILKQAKVIGATTNGAAQFRDVLKAIRPEVVIVEEAGEVFEAHIYSALSEATKHLILIGDHKQLRPKAETYMLTTVSGHGYNLDCSLFERLVTSGLPTATLNVQHRMRPSISQIIRSQTYPTLKDHPSVEQYPDVHGVKGNVIFIDHNLKEDVGLQKRGKNNQKTKANLHEASLCVEILRFFLLQGYQPDQIVVLTPYVGQLLNIMAIIERELENSMGYLSDMDLNEMNEEDAGGGNIAGSYKDKVTRVRCATIDNFQGEEADIVIVSLVRSNSDGKIGFLKEEQRVNVLMSRARYGLYIVGNKDTFLSSRKGEHVWRPILQMMQVRKGLPTYCVLHPNDEPIELSDTGTFRKYRPNGGCSRQCNYRMQCGHVCPLCCHPVDRNHQAAQKKCCEPCKRFPPECSLNHPCQKFCKDECGPCETLVGPTTLLCGHTLQTSRCHDVRNAKALQELTETCAEKVLFQFSPCGHVKITDCSNAHSDNPKCPEICSHSLKCGHECSKRCGTCKDDGHSKCSKKCERKLFCGHICGLPCHEGICGPCTHRCELKCRHSQCPSTCKFPCSPCVHQCEWVCEHLGRCHLICSAPCSRLPCNNRCSKLLACGHRCPTVCGEDCPDQVFCQICGSESNRSHIIDMINLSSFKDHDLDQDPIVILPCNHFYSISTMDNHFSMDLAYEKQDDHYIATKTLYAGQIDPKPRGCIDCRAVIHSVFRYGRVINFAELQSLERKHSMRITGILDKYSQALAGTTCEQLESVIARIKKSPMHCVFEACEASDQVEVSAPPAHLLIRAMKMLSEKHIQSTNTLKDNHYEKACEVLRQCIDLCDSSQSHSSACEVRLTLSTFLLTFNSLALNDEIKREAHEMLDWIINHPTDFRDMKRKAVELKNQDHVADIRSVIKAMHVHDGYDYGGSWSDHWYQCENGHLYFIGNCGQAMQESRCVECRVAIGGTDHQLLQSNRGARERIEGLL